MRTINIENKKESERTYLSVSKLCNGAGLLACACMIIYFFVMSAFNLEEILLLRGFNFIFLLGGILLTFYLYRRIEEHRIDYFKGLKMGIWITFMAVIPFALFMSIYLTYDNHLMLVIKQSTSVGEYLNPIIIFGSTCIEGISSGLIITFILMQYFKQE